MSEPSHGQTDNQARTSCPSTDTRPLLSPWQLARDIASWLPDVDQRRAERIIREHEERHRAAERLDATQGAD